MLGYGDLFLNLMLTSSFTTILKEVLSKRILDGLPDSDAALHIIFGTLEVASKISETGGRFF